MKKPKKHKKAKRKAAPARRKVKSGQRYRTWRKCRRTGHRSASAKRRVKRYGGNAGCGRFHDYRPDLTLGYYSIPIITELYKKANENAFNDEGHVKDVEDEIRLLNRERKVPVEMPHLYCDKMRTLFRMALFSEMRANLKVIYLGQLHNVVTHYMPWLLPPEKLSAMIEREWMKGEEEKFYDPSEQATGTDDEVPF